MKKLIKKPHLFFFLAVPITIVVGVLNRYEATGKTLDFNVHDSYFLIAHFHLIYLIAIIFAIIGIGYWIMHKTDRKLINWLNWIHIVLTFGGTLLVWILSQFYRTGIMEYKFNNNLTSTITLIIALIILGQLIFPINIIYGLIKKKKLAAKKMDY